MPKEIIDKLNQAVVMTLTDTTVRKRLASTGQEIWPHHQQALKAFRAFHKAEIAKW